MCYILSGIGAGYKRARGKREQGVSLSSHKVMRPDNPRVTCDSPSPSPRHALDAARAARRARATACASTTETPRVRERARKDLRKTKRYIYMCVYAIRLLYRTRYGIAYRGTVTPLACVSQSPAPAVYV